MFQKVQCPFFPLSEVFVTKAQNFGFKTIVPKLKDTKNDRSIYLILQISRIVVTMTFAHVKLHSKYPNERIMAF